jgi:peptidoglycan/LPS O-acetylase OafA/YrhL
VAGSSGPTRCTRLGAAATLALAWAVATSAATRTDLAAYDAVLVEVVLLAALGSAAALAWTDRWEARLTAALVAVLTVSGHVLTAVVGGPGGTGGRWTPQAVPVVLAGCLAVLLLGADAHQRTRSATPERPYAR